MLPDASIQVLLFSRMLLPHCKILLDHTCSAFDSLVCAVDPAGLGASAMASAAPGSALSEVAPPLPDVGEQAGGGGAQVKVESEIERQYGRRAAELESAAAAAAAAAGGEPPGKRRR